MVGSLCINLEGKTCDPVEMLPRSLRDLMYIHVEMSKNRSLTHGKIRRKIDKNRSAAVGVLSFNFTSKPCEAGVATCPK